MYAVSGAPAGREKEPAMQTIARSVLDAIGNTPIVELRKVTPAGSARILGKLEFANPTGSMKYRMTKAAIEGAEARDLLTPGATVVEYTAGTTGVSLALVCAVKGYHLEIVFSDAFSEEKRRMMEAFGARITDVTSERKKITESLIKAMIDTAAEISLRPQHWYRDQINNTDAVNGYRPLGEEIRAQTEGPVDAFVRAVGTAHASHGAAEALRAQRPGIRIVAVEPHESAVLSGSPTGSHQIEGVGIGFLPPLWNPELVDEIQSVARSMPRRWCAGWPLRKESLRAHRRAPMWWLPFAWRNGWGPVRRW